MKPTLFAFLALSGSLTAQEPALRPAPEAFEKGDIGHAVDFDEAPGSPLQVQVTVELIEVPQAEATRLLYKEKLGKDGTKLRAALQTMVDSQKASVLETMMALAKSGQKATAESIREVIYPTEYEPPSLPPDSQSQNTQSGSFPVGVGDPTAFETRNVGSTLEIEPTVGEDGSLIDLRLVPEIVFEAGVRKWNARKDELGNESALEMPYFYCIRTNSALTLADGMPQLLSLLTPKSAEGTPDPSRKVLVIVTADLVKVRLKPTP